MSQERTNRWPSPQTPATATPASPRSAQTTQAQVHVVGQYIKDLSFESPNVRKLIGGPGDQPQLRVEVHVNANKVVGQGFRERHSVQGRGHQQGRA